MKKRGLNQVDWAISLGIFLIYIAWFFVFLKPQIVMTADLAPLQSIIEDNLDDYISWQVNKTPVFISSQQNRSGVPVFVNFAPNAGDRHFGLLNGKDFFYDRGKIFVLEDFENSTSYFWIAESSANYSHNNSRLDVDTFGNFTSTSRNFSAEFINGVLKTVRYKNIERVHNSTCRINSYAIPTTSNYLTDYGILAEYKVITQPLTLFSRVIAKNSVIWFNSVRNDNDTVYILKFQAGISGFDNYFSDNDNYGNFSEDNCYSYKKEYLKFYDSADSLLFILPNQTSIDFCNNQTEISLNITMRMTEEREFFMILDDANYTKDDFTGYTANYGKKLKRSGISLDILSGLDYEAAKKDWGYPQERHFQIVIWNSSVNKLNRTEELVRIGQSPHTAEDVYANEYRKFALNSLGGLSEVTVNINTW